MNLLVLILGWLLTVIVVLGNGFVILLITRRPSLRTTAGGIFIFSLAVADFCLGLTFFPLRFVSNRHLILEYFVVILQLVFQYASLANLCVLVADRYFSVAFPLRYTHFFTQKGMCTGLIASWTIALLVAILHLIPYFTTVSHFTVMVIIHTVIFSITPAFILVFTTIHLMIVVRRLRQQTLLVTAQLSFNKMYCNVSVNKRFREFDYVKVIAVLVSVFGIFSLVDTVANVCFIAKIPQSTLEKMDYLVIILQLINSAVNPFVYAYHKKDIRVEVKRFFGQGPTANAVEV